MRTLENPHFPAHLFPRGKIVEKIACHKSLARLWVVRRPETGRHETMKTPIPSVFHPGTFAFYDTFSGLIPCKVVAIRDNLELPENLRGASSDCRITVKLTAPRGAYRKGETVESDALKIIPRPFIIRRRNSMPRIRGGYRWIDPTAISTPYLAPGPLESIAARYEAEGSAITAAKIREAANNGGEVLVYRALHGRGFSTEAIPLCGEDARTAWDEILKSDCMAYDRPRVYRGMLGPCAL